jgi:hypothetical protein
MVWRLLLAARCSRHLNHILLERLRAWILHLPDAFDDDARLPDFGDAGNRVIRTNINIVEIGNLRWSRLSEQNLRIDKWSVCQG